jgi:hypothetical protein
MSQQNSQTVITQEVDGIEVIRGFGKLAIDPIETRKVAAIAIQLTTEYKSVAESQGARNESARKAGEEHTKMKSAKNPQDKNKAWRAAETHRNMAISFEGEIKERLPELKKKEKEIRLSQAVYFEPKLGEHAKSDAEIQALRGLIESVKGPGYVDLDGNILEDNRGVIYCMNDASGWKIERIQTIGVKVPASAVLYSALDEFDKKDVDLQIEINLAAGMSAAEKITAKAAATERALANSESYHTRLKIAGDTEEDAMPKSQAYFQSRIDELVLIYG